MYKYVTGGRYHSMLHLVMLQSDVAMLTLDWQIQMLTAVFP